jgi:glutaconyl-CoA/methylmalonyl-CoA decarboxylase subunit gamma
MKKFRLKINETEYDVDILNIEDNLAQVNVNGKPYTVEIDKKIQQSKTPKLVRSVAAPSTDVVTATSKTAAPNAPKGVGVIKSPLPGTILSIHVKVGDTVNIGDKLLTLEAMKMENNINSDKAGRVVEIKINKGDSVLEGDLLITIGQ